MSRVENPFVSFVVISYNYGRFLGDCLDSILSQEGTHDFEIILVDDASTDETEAVLRLYSDPRIRCIRHEKNLGFVATFNEGFANARGPYIARIDCDDRYRSYYLTEVMDVFRKFDDVGLVYGDVALINERGEVTQSRSDRIHGSRNYKGNEFLALLEENFIPSPTVIARCEAWKEALPIPDGLGFVDWYLTVRVARKYDFFYIDRPLADYRVHSQNLHSKMIWDRSEETTVLRILAEIFAEKERAEEKRRVRRRIYGAQYLSLANKYFGFHMNADARRCYLQALRHKPRYLFRADMMRRLGATFIGRKAYERSKSLIKSTLER